MYNFRAYNNLAVSGINLLERPKVNLPSPSGSSFLSSLTQVARREITTVTDEPTIATLTLRKDIKLPVPNLIQGYNECGPTALEMIKRYIASQTNTSSIISPNYHNIFPSDTVGHGPLELRRVATSKGLIVRQENNGSLEDLAMNIDNGIPVLVLGIYGGGTNSSLSNYIDNASRAHWMTVTGYKKDDAGQITNIYFNDPNRSTTQCWSASDFLNKFWNNNILPEGHRYFMSMAKPGTYQASFLSQMFPNAQDNISGSFKTYLTATDAIERLFYKVEAAGGNAWAAARKLTAKIEALIRNGVSNIAQEIYKAFNEVYNAVMDALHAVADAADDVWDWLT